MGWIFGSQQWWAQVEVCVLCVTAGCKKDLVDGGMSTVYECLFGALTTCFSVPEAVMEYVRKEYCFGSSGKVAAVGQWEGCDRRFWRRCAKRKGSFISFKYVPGWGVCSWGLSL